MKLLPVLLTLAACVRLPHVDPLPRSDYEREKSVAEVYVSCDADFFGTYSVASGVVISERHILTAAHSVTCPVLPDVRVVIDGKRWIVVVEREDVYNDIARLELMSAENFNLGIAPPLLGRAQPGDLGWVYRIWEDTPVAVGYAEWGGTIFRTMHTRAGDSGAPVYSYDGRLFGIVIGGNGVDTRISPVEPKWLEGT